MWKSRPGFTLAAILCLTLGIGATTGIFSVVNAVLLRPLPYQRPDQLIRVYSEFPTFPNGGLRRFWISPPEFLDLRRDTHSWQSLDAWVTGGANLAGQTQPVRVTAAFISGGMLPMLGVSPLQGRLINADDDKHGTGQVVDISYGLWQSAFGGDPNIVGRETLLNGAKCTIIGVMPRGFEFPPGEIDPPQVWNALQLDPAKPGGRGSHYLYLLGRLKPGVSSQQAQAELQSLVQAYGEHRAPNTHAFNPTNHTIVSYGLHGLGLAFGSLRLVRLTNAGQIPRAAEIGLDWRVLLFTIAVATITGILFGLAPILSLLLSDLSESLKETAASTTGASGAQVF